MDQQWLMSWGDERERQAGATRAVYTTSGTEREREGESGTRAAQDHNPSLDRRTELAGTGGQVRSRHAVYALLCLAAAEHKHHDVPTWTLAHAHHYWLPGSRRSAYKGKGEEVRDWSVTSERGRASEPNVTGSIGNPNRAGCVCLLSPLKLLSPMGHSHASERARGSSWPGTRPHLVLLWLWAWSTVPVESGLAAGWLAGARIGTNVSNYQGEGGKYRSCRAERCACKLSLGLALLARGAAGVNLVSI
jgi:hypothetical protein